MAIIGNQNPIVGITYDYEISESFNVNDMLVSDIQYVWHLHKKIDGAWMNVTKDKGKIGKKVQYVFYEKVLGIPFRLEVYKAVKNILSSEYEATKLASLEVIPSSASSPKINRVVLFNRGAKDPNKASYQDTLIAQAQCVAMFNKEIEFQLWEDDAAGEGHDKNINKNNTTNLKFNARVNENGIAEVRIPLSSNQNVLKAIANRYLMQGDQNEGTNHEYYVTASYAGQIKANQVNVNVANPDHGQKPKNDSFIGSGTSSRPPRHDGIGKIKDAYFVNSKNQKLSKAGIGNFVIVKILTENMKGKVVTLKIWEEDNGFDDLVFEKNIRLNEAESYYRVDITKSVFDKGYGTDRTIFGSPVDSDSVQQTYYIEIIPLDDSVDSKSFGLTSEGLMKVDVAKSPAVVKEPVQQTSNCGEKYCIKLGDKNELVREINIRLAGFGGNVPTDEFTERTEKMVKQFQKDYMKVPETGKVCGNTLRAIDEFGSKYKIPFDRIKCKCGSCSGFGNGSFSEQSQDSSISEKYRKYEYPGIHRTIYWATKALMHYFATLESGLGYKVGDISSGYRCHVDNAQNKRGTTNHMGKALDLHIYRTSDNKRAGGRDRGADEGRDLFVKYSNAKINWTTSNEISLEPRNIAPTWVHVDVREFEIKYLEDGFFANDGEKADGGSIFSMAFTNYPNTCTCGGAFNSETTPQQLTNQPQDFDIEDAEQALKVIYDKYGREMAIKVERIYRWETSHFQSKQYRLTGTGGMESHGVAPNYGWHSGFFETYPEYSLMGLTSLKEGAGLSAEGGNQQDTVNAKQFVIFPSVEGAMMYLAEFINRYGGNHGRWYSTDADKQQLYKSKLEGVVPRIVNTF